MTCEQKFLLHILNSSINSKEIEDYNFNDIDWELFLAECINHSVILQCYDKLSSLKHILPENVYNNLKNISYKVLLRNSLISNQQYEIVEILENNNIPYVIIKGESSSYYYPKPELRILGDVDVLIRESDKDTAKSILIKNNYTPSMEGHKCHTVYKRDNAHIEIHHKPAGIPDSKIGKIIEDYLLNATEKPLIVSDDNSSFKISSCCNHAVIILLHMQHHLTGDGLGLRHLVDWATFLSKTYHDEFWNNELIPFLKSVGLMNFTSIITKICEKFLGVLVPFEYECDDTTAELILEDILSGGNFGAKDKMRSKSSMMISKSEKPNNKYISLYNVFKNSVYEQHKIVREHKILYPLFFVYRFVRYFVLVLFNKRQFFVKAIPQAESRIKLYEKLHLFEVNVNE